MLHDLVPFRGIDVVTDALARHTTADGLVVAADGAERTVPADVVVTAIGYRSNTDLREVLRRSPVPSHLLGDARSVSNIMYAIWDAFEVATAI